ncbi:hypothetical protein HDV02_005886 [Globomyces sp. JEL0801]|nr:hypothetical protein HDV02_005886 [Globomyces sp. JEL0801]
MSGTTYCLNPHSNANLVIPMLIKGTPPFYLDYEIWTETGSKLFENVTINNQNAIAISHEHSLFSPTYTQDTEIASIKTPTRRVGLYGIETTKEGVYTLKAARESSGDDVKIIKNDPVSVVTCPSAHWNWNDGSQASNHNFDACVEETIDFSIEVNGVPPFSILYSEKVGKTEGIVAIDNYDAKETSYSTSPSVPELVKRNQAATYRVPVLKKIEDNEPYVFTLVRIVDGLNNTIEYSAQIDTVLPPISSKGTKWKLPENGDLFAVNGHSAPVVSFADCQDIKLRTSYDPSYQQVPVTTVPLTLEGSSPFQVELEFKPDSDMPVQPLSIENIKGNVEHLTATSPGKYKILSVKDKYCQGTVNVPKTCLVQAVNAPSVSFTSTPIEESCFGTLGTNVDLLFTGQAPFWVEYSYNVWKGNKQTYRSNKIRETFNQPRNVLSLKPSADTGTGTYKFVFEKVGDRNYNEGVNIIDQTVTQIIHPTSTAKFILPNYSRDSPYQFVKCIGDSLDLEVSVEGTGPWVVSYEITMESTIDRVSHKVDAAEKGFTIPIKNLSKGGIYSVILTEIKDGNGCFKKLDTDPVNIEVVSNRPSISFQSLKTIYALEDSKSLLPISLSGRGPFSATFKHIETDKVYTRSIPMNSRSIDVFGSGTFELLSIHDKVCEGHVEGISSIEVLTIPKPVVSIQSSLSDTLKGNSIIRSPLCKDSESYFQIDLKGKAPFQLKLLHEIQYFGESQKATTLKISESVETSFFRILLDSTVPGIHTYKLVSVADDNYKSPIQLQDLPTVVQQVNDVPTADFIEPEKSVFYCTSSGNKSLELKMTLRGQPPFTMAIEQRHDNQHAAFINRVIEEDQLQLDSDHGYQYSLMVPAPSFMGKHDFILDSLVDATKCEVSYEKSTNRIMTSVEIADQARITLSTSQIVCVGDLISYSLQGTPPFTIGYNWNGVPQEPVTVADPMLNLFAGAGGQIMITKVCNSMGCCDESVEVDDKLATTIKPLPKAIVGQGDDSFDDIREGIDNFDV